MYHHYYENIFDVIMLISWLCIIVKHTGDQT